MQTKKKSIVQTGTKDIPGYEGLYYATEDGRIYSHTRAIYDRNGNFRYFKKGREVIGEVSVYGYRRVILSSNGIAKKHFVHRLISFTFLNPVKGKEIVNHKDGNKLNNRVDNLEWCTMSENTKHAFDMGLAVPSNKLINTLPIEEIVSKYRYRSSESGIIALAKEYGVSKSLIYNIIKGNEKYAQQSS